MRRAGLAVLSLVALAACASKPVESTESTTPSAEAPAVLEEPADAPVTQATYTCDNGVKLDVTFDDNGSAHVKAGTDAALELPGVIAASGNKFSDGRHTLWTKGMDEATWIVGRMTPALCTAD